MKSGGQGSLSEPRVERTASISLEPSVECALTGFLHDRAERATAEAPFYWLRMELNEGVGQFELKLWNGWTDEDRLLAVVHPHGEFALWQ